MRECEILINCQFVELCQRTPLQNSVGLSDICTIKSCSSYTGISISCALGSLSNTNYKFIEKNKNINNFVVVSCAARHSVLPFVCITYYKIKLAVIHTLCCCPLVVNLLQRSMRP